MLFAMYLLAKVTPDQVDEVSEVLNELFDAHRHPIYNQAAVLESLRLLGNTSKPRGIETREDSVQGAGH